MKKYSRHTLYVPNGVSLTSRAADRSDAILQKFGLEDRAYIASVGRLVPEKRIHDLIEAFAKVDTDYRLAIVGDGRYSQDYTRRLHALAQSDQRVVFTYHQSGDTLWALQSRAALQVSSSELEGLPNAVLEGVTYGVPMVLSDIPPHRELLSDVDEYDLFFRVGDTVGLADRLRLVIANPEKYRAVALRARAAAEQRFNWAEIAASTEQIYYQVTRPQIRSPAARASSLLGSKQDRPT
jgi:glycosyltransferase involved in cell wall biosynthesis